MVVIDSMTFEDIQILMLWSLVWVDINKKLKPSIADVAFSMAETSLWDRGLTEVITFNFFYDDIEFTWILLNFSMIDSSV